jgi:hypothetical protein
VRDHPKDPDALPVKTRPPRTAPAAPQSGGKSRGGHSNLIVPRSRSVLSISTARKIHGCGRSGAALCRRHGAGPAIAAHECVIARSPKNPNRARRINPGDFPGDAAKRFKHPHVPIEKLERRSRNDLFYSPRGKGSELD